MLSTSFEDLITTHVDKVHALARELHGVKSTRFGRDELAAIGLEGLVEAAHRFDPSHGVKFWSFAYPRVRGAMMDAVRQTMPLPHAVYEPLAAAQAAVHATTPGTAAHEEARARLAEANETVGLVAYEAMASVRCETVGVHGGVDRFTIEDDEPTPHPDPLDDGTSRVMRVDALDPERALEQAQRLAALHAALGALTLEERLILHGLYFEERGLVNEVLGHSKSWTSRLHTRALRRLRAMLQAEWGHERAKAAPAASIPAAAESPAEAEPPAEEVDEAVREAA